MFILATYADGVMKRNQPCRVQIALLIPMIRLFGRYTDFRSTAFTGYQREYTQ